ncbi:hypothetical protein RUND412_001560 [Rhizina undulata]
MPNYFRFVDMSHCMVKYFTDRLKPLKRKADVLDEEVSAERHQLDDISHESESINNADDIETSAKFADTHTILLQLQEKSEHLQKLLEQAKYAEMELESFQEEAAERARASITKQEPRSFRGRPVRPSTLYQAVTTELKGSLLKLQEGLIEAAENYDEERHREDGLVWLDEAGIAGEMEDENSLAEEDAYECMEEEHFGEETEKWSPN